MSKIRIINSIIAVIIAVGLVILTIRSWASQGDISTMTIVGACLFYPMYVGVLWNVVDEYIKMKEAE